VGAVGESLLEPKCWGAPAAQPKAAVLVPPMLAEGLATQCLRFRTLNAHDSLSDHSFPWDPQLQQLGLLLMVRDAALGVQRQVLLFLRTPLQSQGPVMSTGVGWQDTQCLNKGPVYRPELGMQTEAELWVLR